MPDRNMTELLNSTSRMTIRPTELERLHGRLMRAPDHPGGDGGDDGSDAGGDGGDADQGADQAAADTGAGGDANKGDAGSDADSSLLGDAKADADAGTGDGGADDTGDGEDGGDNQDKADGPPETYDLKVTTKAEDGTDTEVEIDKALLDEATPTFKELGLTNDQANKLAPLAVKVQERMAQAQADDFTAMKTAWAKEAKADKDIGGAKWAETEALAARALDTFGAPSAKDKDGNETNPFRILLNDTGLGNHPDMIRMFRAIGEKLGEDTVLANNALKATKPDRLAVLYPDDVPKDQKQGAK